MKDKLRELAERWKGEIPSQHDEYLATMCSTRHDCARAILSILDTEGDGGAVDTGNLVDDPLYLALDALYERGWNDSEKHKHDARGTNEWQRVLDLFRATYPARSGVVSDEGVRDAAMDAALITKAQKIVRDVWETWYPGNEWTPANSMHDLLCQIGNSLLGVPEFASAADSRLHAQNAINAAIQGERHER